MSTAIHVIPEPLPTTTETRFAAYLLADYLERLGVEVVFGLTGHTVIGMLDALGREPHPLRQHPARAGRGARGRRLRQGLRQARRAAHPSRPRADQRRDRRRQRRARLDPDGGDRRRRAVVLPRPPSAPGDQPSPGRRPVPDLSPVLQARLSRRQRARSAAHHGARVPPRAVGTSGSGPRRRADGRLLDQPAGGRVQQGAGGDRASDHRRGDRGADRRRAGQGRAPGALRRRRRALGARLGGARRARRSARAADRAHA